LGYLIGVWGLDVKGRRRAYESAGETLHGGELSAHQAQRGHEERYHACLRVLLLLLLLIIILMAPPPRSQRLHSEEEPAQAADGPADDVPARKRLLLRAVVACQ
jgi:hypothetical protein